MSRVTACSRQVRAGTADGPVRLGLGTAPDLVESASDDGSVALAPPHAAYRVTTHTEDGSAHVSVPRDDSGTRVVSARTADGNITVCTAN